VLKPRCSVTAVDGLDGRKAGVGDRDVALSTRGPDTRAAGMSRSGMELAGSSPAR
jgi:hypothetical protein